MHFWFFGLTVIIFKIFTFLQNFRNIETTKELNIPMKKKKTKLSTYHFVLNDNEQSEFYLFILIFKQQYILTISKRLVYMIGL